MYQELHDRASNEMLYIILRIRHSSHSSDLPLLYQLKWSHCLHHRAREIDLPCSFRPHPSTTQLHDVQRHVIQFN